ncbi:hypothetical protein KGP36_07910 [Patescibacteria group bacterium]|nr:hypothetical protein [Patescibacteria group bacterium]MDE1940598.1 hypothetical protein [Patescibacteria group bacterium]
MKDSAWPHVPESLPSEADPSVTSGQIRDAIHRNRMENSSQLDFSLGEGAEQLLLLPIMIQSNSYRRMPR